MAAGLVLFQAAALVARTRSPSSGTRDIREDAWKVYWLAISLSEHVHTKWLRPMKRLVTPAATVEQTSAFLNLPLDILHCIFDELSPSAQILLPQTCRAIRYTLPRDRCSLHHLTTLAWDEEFQNLSELGNLLPDQYHCTGCNTLRSVQPDDSPDLINWYRRRRRRHRCHSSHGTHNHVIPHPSFSVSFHHVQLALKYSRTAIPSLSPSLHQDCLANILRGFGIRQTNSPIIKSFTAKPKVVSGRFILLTTYVLHADPLRDAGKSYRGDFVHFCPHHHFGICVAPGDVFAQILQKAVVNVEMTARGDRQYMELFSCDRCSTDYSIVAKDNDEAVVVVVKAWHDLGTGLSVRDRYWQSHLFSLKYGLYTRVKFNYEHGSISKMYDSCCS